MNHKLTLIIFFFSFLIITAFSKRIKVQEIYPLPLKITENGHNKLTVHVSWNFTGEPDTGIINIFLKKSYKKSYFYI